MKKWYLKPYISNWTIGWNDYYKSSCIYLREIPLIVSIIDTCISYICDWLSYIPLPNITIKLDKESAKWLEKDTTTMREWYGSVGGIFHSVVHMPIFEWCENNTINNANINIPYQYSLKKFEDSCPYDKDYIYDDDEKELAINVKNIREKQYEEWEILQKKLDAIIPELKNFDN